MTDIGEHFDRLLSEACTPATVRAIEAGGGSSALWQTLDAAGFLDALVPESAGGQGLSLADTAELVVAMGRHALPVPAAATLFARAALARNDGPVVREPVAIAPATFERHDRIECPRVPYGLVADWVVVTFPRRWWLLPAAAAERTATGIHGDLHADFAWTTLPDRGFSAATLPWLEAGAITTAASIAGALQRVLDITVAFANDRNQFGRPIGKFQAIQHQLAVMAESVAAARAAALLGWRGDGLFPSRLAAALAKARTSEAAALVAPLAHAIHGAIGVTAELDLQLYTRRLHEWRADFGAERAWHDVLGGALLDSGASTLDFMRNELLAP